MLSGRSSGNPNADIYLRVGHGKCGKGRSDHMELTTQKEQIGSASSSAPGEAV